MSARCVGLSHDRTIIAVQLTGRLSGAEIVMVVASAPAFVAIGYAGRVLSPATITVGRTLVGATTLTLVWLAVRSRRPGTPRAGGLRLSDVPRLLLLGLLGYVGYSMLVSYGEQTVAPGIAALIANSSPVLITAFGVLVMRTGVTARVVAGVTLAFAGTAAVALVGSGGAGAHHSAWTGLAMIAGASLSLAWYAVLQQPLFARVEPLAVAAAVTIGASVVALPLLPAAVADLVGAGAVRATGVPGAVPSVGHALLAVVLLGVVATALGYGSWIVALARLGSAGGSLSLFLIPVLTMALSVVLLGESLRPLAVLGGAMALVGVLLARREPTGTADVPVVGVAGEPSVAETEPVPAGV
jgi:drug/metabolite transporter (DMT)-like permease